MKRFFLFKLVILALIYSSFGQSEWISFDSKYNGQHSKVEAELINSSQNSSVVSYSLEGFYLTSIEVNDNKSDFHIPNLEGSSRLLKATAPDLIKFTTSLVIPDLSAVKVNVLEAEYEEYENIAIAPSKGNLLRIQDPNEVPFVFGDVYSEDAFFPAEIAEVGEPYIIRDIRGAALHVYPFRYNPVSGVLRVYKNIVVEIVEYDGEVINALTTLRNNTIDPEFRNIYTRHFLNYESLTSYERYTPIEEYGGILVISYGDFMDAMTPYVEWKNQMGRHTEIVDVATVGSTPNEIKSYIEDYYENNNLGFILLVGEAHHIPPFEFSLGGWGGNGHSDNMYTYINGGEGYPDALIGRFSAENVSHVETMVQRTLEYEKVINQADNWYNVAMGVARDEGSGQGHNGESDCEHMDIIRDRLLTYNYTTVHQDYDHGCDGVPDTNASQMSSRINAGVSMINFCNHGSTTGWSVAGYNAGHVNGLTNVGKLPFIWSVACVNGNFVGNTCFAETWLRATHNGEPTGAIATFMATINQAWNPPMDAQDEFSEIMIGSYSDNIKRTFAGIAMNGCMKMNDINGAAGIQETNAWTVFGDPSISIRTDEPLSLAISHDPDVLVGTDEITVHSDVVGAYISLTIQNQIIGTGTIGGNGTVTIEVEELWDPEHDILVVATAYNRIPAFGEIEIIEELLDLDLEAFNIIEPLNQYACSGVELTPKVVVRNRGELEITSFDLYYSFNNEDPEMISWEGNLPSLETEIVELSGFTLEQGPNTFMFYVDNPNNDIDENNNNDTLYKSFSVSDLNIISEFLIEEFNQCAVPAEVKFINISQNVESYHWDFGDGNTSTSESPTHEFTELGSYLVTLTADAGVCGYEVSEEYIFIGAAPPIVDDVYFCENSSVTISPTGQGQFYWYDDEELNNLIYQGNHFTTPELTEATSFYVMSEIQSSYYGAREAIDESFGGGYFTSDIRHGLVFNVHEPVTLKSVKVFSNEAKNREIVLENSNGQVIATRNAYINEGEHRVTLNFDIPVGEDYILYGPESPNLYREGSTGSWWNPAPELPYPYIIEDAVEIYESTADNYESNFYYYFYDWEILKSCSSPAVEVVANLFEGTVNADFSFDINNYTAEFTNNSEGGDEYYWDFGDGNSSTDENPYHVYDSIGEYTVILISSNLCDDDTVSQEIIILNIDELKANNIKVYPNPTSSVCYIQSQSVIGKISLLDATGRLIKTKKVNSDNYELNMESLTSGVYIIRVYDVNDNSYNLRIIKE